jgi:hypothetical protein
MERIWTGGGLVLVTGIGTTTLTPAVKTAALGLSTSPERTAIRRAAREMFPRTMRMRPAVTR